MDNKSNLKYGLIKLVGFIVCLYGAIYDTTTPAWFWVVALYMCMNLVTAMENDKQ